MPETNQPNIEAHLPKSEYFETPGVVESTVEATKETYTQVVEHTRQEADRAVGELLVRGKETANHIASGMKEGLDEQVNAELMALQIEATEARSELEQSIEKSSDSVEVTTEKEAAVELRQAGEKLSVMLTEAGILQPDGSFVDDARDIFEAMLPENQQKFQDLSGSVEALSKSLGEDIFAVDALTTLPMELRQNIIGEAAAKVAHDNPEGYLSSHIIAQEHGLIPAFTSDEERESKLKIGAQIFVRHQRGIIEVQLASDPLEAAKLFSKVRNKARNSGLQSIEIPEGLEKAVKDRLNQIEQTGGDPAAYFRELPDETPGLNAIALALVRNKMASVENHELGKTKALQTYGETAPDALLAVANAENHYTTNAWTDDEVKGLIQRVVRLPDAKQSILAETHIPRDADQATLDAFQTAYEQYSPGNLIVYADRFPNVSFDEQLANRAFDTGSVQYVVGKIDIFHGLTRRFAEKLIIHGRARDVMKHPEKFSGLTFDTNLALTLFERDPSSLSENLNSFVDKKAVIDEMVQKIPALVLDKIGSIPSITPEQILVAIDSPNVSLTQRLDVIKRTPGLDERSMWGNSLLALEKIQARSARAEHDPWITDLDPLTRAAIDQGVLSPQSREDGDLLVSFVQEFGAVRAVRTLEVFVSLKRAKSLDDLSEPIQNELRLVLGEKKLEKMRTPEAAINALRNYRREVTGSLLRDETPAGMESEIGKEVLGSLKGATRWERKHDSAVLLSTWKETIEKNPDVAKIPEGYHEVAFSVRARKRSEAGADPSVDQRRTEVINNTDTQKRFRTFQEGFRTGLQSIEHIVVGAREQLSDTLREQIAKTEARMVTLPEKAQIGVKKNIDALNRQLERVIGFGSDMPVSEKPSDKQITSLLKEVAGWNTKDINLNSLLRALSVAHMRETAPPQFVEVIQKFGQSGEIATDAELTASRDFIADYLNEHYLHPDQQHQTEHEAFPSDVLKALRQAWQIASGAEDHPLVRAGNELRQLDKGTIAEDTVDVSLVPVQGPLRIFSGDIGDACYTSKHDQLARGEVPDLHSMVFVTGRGTANERLAGSVLFVETESDTGEPILMVRANNPRENLLQSVDADELIAQTLSEAIAVAERRGITRVVVPRDASSSSSSNRPDVAGYYQKNFAEAPKIGLKDEPETNFNGYKNWDKDGPNAVVEVWAR